MTPNGQVSTLCGHSQGFKDRKGSSASFWQPYDITFDSVRRIFYVADCSNHSIRTVTLNGEVTTLCGKKGERGLLDGDSSVAKLVFPTKLTLDGNGNIFVADEYRIVT